MKNNPKIPKGYQQTKIGVLPVEWEVVKLKSVINKIESGTSVNCSPDSKSSRRILKTSAVTLGSFSPSETKIPLKEEEEKLSTKAKAGHILVCRKNSPTLVGTSVLIDCLEQELYLPDLLWQLILSQNRDGISTFLFYSLNEGHTEFRIRNLASGSSESMRNISKKSYLNLQIPLPPLPQQQKIAAILATWDKAITTQTQLLAAKKEQKRGLMQRLLTGEGEEYKFRDLLRVVKRNFDWDDNELYDLISVRRRSGGLFHRSSLHGHQIKTKTLRTAREGDFLISKMQILHGASGLTTSEFDGMKISGSYLAVVSAKPKLLDIKYLNLLSQTKQFYHKTYISSYGVHIEKMTFDFKTFLKKKVVIPSLEHQQKTVEILTTADREIHLLETRLTELRQQKRGLMQRLLTGQVRVTV